MTRGKVQVGFKAFAVLLRPWAPCRLCRQVCGRDGWLGHCVRRKLLQSVRAGERLRVCFLNSFLSLTSIP